MTIVYGFGIMNEWAAPNMAMLGRGVWNALFSHGVSEQERMSKDDVCGKGVFERMFEVDVSGRRRYRYGE